MPIAKTLQDRIAVTAFPSVLSRPMFRLVLRAAAALLACASVGKSLAADWPGWRGPQRNGLSEESKAPLRWSAADGLAWKIALPGAGISSPIITGDRVLVTYSDGPQQETLHIACLARDSGKELWHKRFWGTAPTLYHQSKSSMASPTPVTDGRFVYAFFGTGDVFCLDIDGGLYWQRSLAAEYGEFENRFAASSSPLLYRGALLLQCDHYGASYVISIDAKTGENRWKTDRPECWLSWATPQLVAVGDSGKHEFVVCGSHKVDSFDPETGEKLWTVRGLQRECIPTPLFGHGLVYAVSGAKGSTFAITPGGRGDVTDTHVRWTNPRGGPFVPSGILVGTHYYLVDDKGIATCLNALDGKLLWQKRFPGDYTASPVAVAGRVYFTNEAGTTVVIKADSDSYEELARNDIGEPVYASMAISDGIIYLRSARHLFGISGATR